MVAVTPRHVTWVLSVFGAHLHTWKYGRRVRPPNYRCMSTIAAKVPTAADLGKQFRVRGDVLLDGPRGLTGDLFNVMSAAVVAVLAMQPHDGREMLLN